MTPAEFQKVWQAADRARKKYEGHDPNTAQHSVRVAHWAALIASRIPGYGQARLRRLEITALLHDYGKTFIDPKVIQKQGPLDDREWAEMKRHPELGCQHLPVPEEVVLKHGILWHHKRFDGGGYPDGNVAGMQLPLEARIISVADVFDALSSARPYRKEKPAFTPDEALATMHESAGRQLDPSLVALFDSVYQMECERVGGRAGARTMQIRSVIGAEIDRAQALLTEIIGPFNPLQPLNPRMRVDVVLGRLVAGLLRSNLDLKSAENVARYVLKQPLVETFQDELIAATPRVRNSIAMPRHHSEITLRLRRMPAKLSYMHVVVYQGDLWVCVGEQCGEAIEVMLAR
jgi:hypothetical protein